MAKPQLSATDVLVAYQALSPGDKKTFAEALALEPDLPDPLCHLWISPAYAAELLHKSRSTIKNDIKAGRLKTNGLVGRGKQKVRIDRVIGLLPPNPHERIVLVPRNTPAATSSGAKPRHGPAEPTSQEGADFRARQERLAKEMEGDGRYYGGEWASKSANSAELSGLMDWVVSRGDGCLTEIYDAVPAVRNFLLATGEIDDAQLENTDFLTGFIEEARAIYVKLEGTTARALYDRM